MRLLLDNRFQKFAGVLWADRDVCGAVEGHGRGVSEQPLTPAPIAGSC